MVKRPRVRDMIIIGVVVLIGLVWFGIASPDQDWLWFLPVFNEQPTRIHLYRDGEQLVLRPSDQGYEEINQAINHVVRHVKAKESFELSPEFQQEFYDRFSAVELFYPEPVIIHTRHGFPKADKYLIPQSGHYDNPPMIFAGMQRQPEYRAGVLVLESREALDQAVAAAWAAQQQE